MSDQNVDINDINLDMKEDSPAKGLIEEISREQNSDDTNAAAGIDNKTEQKPKTKINNSSPATGLAEEIMKGQTGNDELDLAASPAANSAAPSPAANSAAPPPAASTATNNNNSTDTSTTDNAVYAIIQIDSEKKITVLDNADGQTLTSDKSPYELLANKTPSIFAVKIVKKDNCDGANDQIKCISFGNSHYELDLSETITDTKDKLLNSEFLSEGAVPEPEVAESEGAVPEGVYSKDYTPKFKAGDTINYNGKNSYIRKIGKSTTDGKPLYDIGTGINAAEDVDKTATLVILSHGGSRKNRGQQSKKTKRKYYVYRNNQV
jgi:hypothetical protein